MQEAEQFDWSDKAAIVVRRVDPIAVYTNADGDIVVRQQPSNTAADSVITIPRDRVYVFIEALQRQFKGPSLTSVAGGSL
ncbi:MAG TPA: hypothetical protein VED01_19515 [Burkholderiales bacterium]|nr:hypothetical protein [Burkholderiales bacterium]